MSVNLVIVHSNPQPKREQHYPVQWLFYSQGQELRVQVEHDNDCRPHVLDKGAA
jgi:long-subunit fatty acid transport protein